MFNMIIFSFEGTVNVLDISTYNLYFRREIYIHYEFMYSVFDREIRLCLQGKSDVFFLVFFISNS